MEQGMTRGEIVPNRLVINMNLPYAGTVYINPNHCDKTIQELTAKPRDCIIQIQEKKLEVHRSVMSLVSSYFEASVRFENLSSNFLVPTSHIITTIELNDMDYEAVTLLVEYAYTGRICYTKQNAEDIVLCSDFLCIESISESCSKYLSDTLDYDQVSQLLKNSKNVVLENFTICRTLTLFIAQNFSLFMKTRYFLEFDTKFLINVLSHDKLVVMEELDYGKRKEFFFTTPGRQEELVLKCVLDYVEYVKDNSILPHLIKCVRWGLISAEVRNKLLKLEPIASCSESAKLIKASGNETDSTIDSNKWNRPRDLRDVLAISWSMFPWRESMLLSNNEATKSNLHSRVSNENDRNGANLYHHRRNIARTYLREYFGDSEVFDDSELVSESCPVVFVTGINTYTYSGGEIVGLQVQYSNGTTVQHGLKYEGGRAYSIDINSEKIVQVILSSFNSSFYDAQSTLEFDCCGFRTNKNRVISSGNLFEVPKPTPSACLAFVRGIIRDTLDRKYLQFGWIYNKKMMSK